MSGQLYQYAIGTSSDSAEMANFQKFQFERAGSYTSGAMGLPALPQPAAAIFSGPRAFPKVPDRIWGFARPLTPSLQRPPE